MCRKIRYQDTNLQERGERILIKKNKMTDETKDRREQPIFRKK